MRELEHRAYTFCVLYLSPSRLVCYKYVRQHTHKAKTNQMRLIDDTRPSSAKPNQTRRFSRCFMRKFALNKCVCVCFFTSLSIYTKWQMEDSIFNWHRVLKASDFGSAFFFVGQGGVNLWFAILRSQVNALYRKMRIDGNMYLVWRESKVFSGKFEAECETLGWNEFFVLTDDQMFD